MRSIFCAVFLCVAMVGAAAAQNGSEAGAQPTAMATASPTPAQPPTTIVATERHKTKDEPLGPCSVTFTVKQDGKPVYDVQVKVHISYGAFGVKKLDLSAGTNVDGKVTFAGLPLSVHNPPLLFYAAKGSLTGVATYDPSDSCQAQHDIALVK